MSQQLEIKTKMRFRDAFRYNLFVAYNTVGNRVFVVLSVISLGIFIYYMINGGGRIDERFARAFALLVPPFIFFIMIPVKVWKATGALLNSQILKDEAIYIFSLEKITLKTPQGQADIKWNEYVSIVETRHDIRFFMDKVQAQIIPKYNLTQEEIEKLRQIIGQGADPRFVKLRSN